MNLLLPQRLIRSLALEYNQAAHNRTYEMSRPDESSIKEYKEFVTITNIRKAAEEVITPIIRAIELQMSEILQQHKAMHKRVSEMDSIAKNQSIIEKRLEEAHSNLHSHKEDVEARRRDEDRRSSRLDAANEKLFIEMHNLKVKLDSLEETIKNMNNRNNKMSDMYTALCDNNDKTVKEMHAKFIDFSDQILDQSKAIKKDNEDIKNEIAVARREFVHQREALEQKAQPLQLYLRERAVVGQKFDDIYCKMVGFVTNEDLEGFKKSQKLMFQQLSNKNEQHLQQILPSSLRSVLMTLERKLLQVDKIEDLCIRAQRIDEQMLNVTAKLIENRSEVEKKISILTKRAEEQSYLINKTLVEKLSVLEINNETQVKKLSLIIASTRKQLQKQMQSLVQGQSLKMNKIIEDSLQKAALNAGPAPVSITPTQVQAFKRNAEQVQQLESKMQSQYSYLEQLANEIDYKIASYASKITKIKSDYQLFSDGMRKQFALVNKFKDSFGQKLLQIGQTLTVLIESQFVNTSVLMQNQKDILNLEGSSQHRKQPLVFTVNNDGVVFEWKPTQPQGMISYRCKKLNAQHFLRSAMFSFTEFVGDKYSQLQFVNWNSNKPSDFFSESILRNYGPLSQFKHSDSRNQRQKQARRPQSHYSSAQIHSPSNLATPEGFQKSGLKSSQIKQLSRTIQYSVPFEVGMQEMPTLNATIETKKMYAGKRKNLLAGASKKDKSHEAARYEQIFLTSRSACRSRISQAI